MDAMASARNVTVNPAAVIPKNIKLNQQHNEGMMDISQINILRDEILTDPLGVGYGDMADSGVADALNLANRPGTRQVPATEVRQYVLLHGLWPAIQSIAASSANPLHRGTAITILQTLAPNSFDTIRMNRPDVRQGVSQMLSTMVDAQAMTETHRTEMLALGDTVISRAEELGLTMIHHLDVAEARNGGNIN